MKLYVSTIILEKKGSEWVLVTGISSRPSHSVGTQYTVYVDNDIGKMEQEQQAYDQAATLSGNSSVLKYADQ